MQLRKYVDKMKELGVDAVLLNPAIKRKLVYAIKKIEALNEVT